MKLSACVRAFRADVVLGVVIGTLAFGGGAAGQTSTATLQGTVTDASGAVLPGVTQP